MRSFYGRGGTIESVEAARTVAAYVNRREPGITADALGQAFPQHDIDFAVELRYIYPVVTGGVRYYVGNGSK